MCLQRPFLEAKSLPHISQQNSLLFVNLLIVMVPYLIVCQDIFWNGQNTKFNQEQMWICSRTMRTIPSSMSFFHVICQIVCHCKPHVTNCAWAGGGLIKLCIFLGLTSSDGWCLPMCVLNEEGVLKSLPHSSQVWYDGVLKRLFGNTFRQTWHWWGFFKLCPVKSKPYTSKSVLKWRFASINQCHMVFNKVVLRPKLYLHKLHSNDLVPSRTDSMLSSLGILLLVSK